MTGNNRGLVLQPRDRRLLEELAVMRVVDREQAKTVAVGVGGLEATFSVVTHRGAEVLDMCARLCERAVA